ncbi:hypothetical protein SAMN05877753_102408 [Bacillus oleivorans]|uniref:Uncharacterized protein n=1 Tax=Bacillus oleivorans TaxID=1448271 RepID=A0A285CKW8_9BACI|nr:hypothetical protein SAMN05877753_102408 [Bacillus oleivorans]
MGHSTWILIKKTGLKAGLIAFNPVFYSYSFYSSTISHIFILSEPPNEAVTL